MVIIAVIIVCILGLCVYLGVKDSKEITTDVNTIDNKINTDVSEVETTTTEIKTDINKL